MADKFSIACAIALGLPTHYFLDGMQKMELCRIRFIHYPPCDFVSNQNAKEAATSAIRVGEHTDFGTFTFLFTDSPGLQMKPACGGEANGSSDKAWTDIPLPESKNVSAIVNTGAVFARYTNDKWKAAAHRVIIKDADVAKRSRYSLAGFYGPDREVPVEVIPKLLAPGEKANFDSMTSLEYVNVRLKAAQKL